MTRSGGQLLVDQLVRHAADTVFSVPGESFLPVLDALHDAPIRLITCRHEAALGVSRFGQTGISANAVKVLSRKSLFCWIPFVVTDPTWLNMFCRA